MGVPEVPVLPLKLRGDSTVAVALHAFKSERAAHRDAERFVILRLNDAITAVELVAAGAQTEPTDEEAREQFFADHVLTAAAHGLKACLVGHSAVDCSAGPCT